MENTTTTDRGVTSVTETVTLGSEHPELSDGVPLAAGTIANAPAPTAAAPSASIPPTRVLRLPRTARHAIRRDGRPTDGGWALCPPPVPRGLRQRRELLIGAAGHEEVGLDDHAEVESRIRSEARDGQG